MHSVRPPGCQNAGTATLYKGRILDEMSTELRQRDSSRWGLKPPDTQTRALLLCRSSLKMHIQNVENERSMHKYASEWKKEEEEDEEEERGCFKGKWGWNV